MKLPEFIEKLQFIKDNVWNGNNLFVTVELDGKNKQSNVTGVVYDNEKLRIKVVDGDFITPTMEQKSDTPDDIIKQLSKELELMKIEKVKEKERRLSTADLYTEMR